MEKFEEMKDIACIEEEANFGSTDINQSDDFKDEEHLHEHHGVSQPSKSASGLADAMARILHSDIHENGTDVILKKKKINDSTIQNHKQMKEELQVTTSSGVQRQETIAVVSRDVTKHREFLERKKQKRALQKLGRVKPDLNDRGKERELMRIATRGVVQLFNAVREHQKTLKKELMKVGASEVAKEKVQRSINHDKFLQLLNRAAEPQAPVGRSVMATSGTNWEVLRDDYMIGAKMRDWEKESSGEEEEKEFEDILM